jgi:zinc D-Ala-D-Ala dipeptidase
MMDDIAQSLIDAAALSQQKCRAPIMAQLLYATDENFLGRQVEGYSADAIDVALLEAKTAEALCDVQNNLLENHQLGLLVYDAYRPWRAVKDFSYWFNQPAVGQKELDRKAIHYPHIEKIDLARLGYVAGDVSRHNFGHAVDVVLIDAKTKEPLNMGACFDYFDEISHANVGEEQIGQEAYDNRVILTAAMQAHGFIPYEFEYWHFDFHVQAIKEPIDIPIEAKLKSLNVQ